MTEQRRSKVLTHIEELKEKLEHWKRLPMLNTVRDIGAQAIRKELTRVSRELMLDDVHHMKY
jgi:hypothetical protein